MKNKKELKKEEKFLLKESSDWLKNIALSNFDDTIDEFSMK